MKNDTTTTFLNFVLAALVVLGVLFALLSIWRTRDLRHIQPQVQTQIQQAQYATMQAKALLQDAITFNTTARDQELTRIIQGAQSPAPAAK
jgi:hypothetical protein